MKGNECPSPTGAPLALHCPPPQVGRATGCWRPPFPFLRSDTFNIVVIVTRSPRLNTIITLFFRQRGSLFTAPLSGQLFTLCHTTNIRVKDHKSGALLLIPSLLTPSSPSLSPPPSSFVFRTPPLTSFPPSGPRVFTPAHTTHYNGTVRNSNSPKGGKQSHLLENIFCCCIPSFLRFN